MTTVVVAPSAVASFPDGGGHFWVYMQYVRGLQALGCDVYWLERFDSADDPEQDRHALAVFMDRMRHFGMARRVIVHHAGQPYPPEDDFGGLALAGRAAEQVARRADLLLNFSYSIEADVLRRFDRTALIDIDPGLLQFWISQGQIEVQPHDLYFSTGETVGRPDARFPSCGLPWQAIRPIIHLPDWPVTYDPDAEALTTVSGWWGDEWISDGQDVLYQNNKRVSFMQYANLASRTSQPLELALCLGLDIAEGTEVWRQPDNPEYAHDIDYQGDQADRDTLEGYGWRIRLASQVAGTPEDYRHYIQRSRGEFSCAKPSCMKFQNAWVSDRSLCYMASGKPVIVQHTGPSQWLPDAQGMFRFSTPDEALSAIDDMNANYRLHCEASRELAERLFSAETVLRKVLEVAC